MIKNKISKTVWSISLPVFFMILLILPLLFILVKRYFSTELISFSIFNSFILTSGMLLNIFIFRELEDRVKNFAILLLIVFTSAGFSISGFIYILIYHPLFFLYGIEVIVSYILLTFILITGLSLFSCASIHNQRVINNERELREKIERMMYSSKINPHFLFNSLNLMVSLLDDKLKAEHVLISLSELLRYNLEASKKELVSLKSELDSIKKYLYIQKERFGNRLSYEINCDIDIKIPPLILQPIVENSIKHNIDTCNSINITVSVFKKKNLLLINLFDSEKKIETEMIGKGTGLEVVKKIVEVNSGSLRIENGGVIICFPDK